MENPEVPTSQGSCWQRPQLPVATRECPETWLNPTAATACPQLQPENNGFPVPSSTEFQGCASHWQTITWNYADKDAGKCSSQSSFQGGMLVLITQYNLPLFSTQIQETFITHVHLPTNLMFLLHMRHLPLALQK